MQERVSPELSSTSALCPLIFPHVSPSCSGVSVEAAVADGGDLHLAFFFFKQTGLLSATERQLRHVTSSAADKLHRNGFILLLTILLLGSRLRSEHLRGWRQFSCRLSAVFTSVRLWLVATSGSDIMHLPADIYKIYIYFVVFVRAERKSYPSFWAADKHPACSVPQGRCRALSEPGPGRKQTRAHKHDKNIQLLVSERFNKKCNTQNTTQTLKKRGLPGLWQ